MFQFSYTPYLSVSFNHPYYFNGVTNDFICTPIQGTLDALNSFGLKYKNIGGTLFIHQQRDDQNLPFNEIDAIVNLYFIVAPTTNVLNITERFGSGRYFFSNLKPDGTYNPKLTSSALLSAADELPSLTGEQMVLDFLPNTLTKVVLSNIIAGTGWKTIMEFPVKDTDNHLGISVSSPGLYRLEKFKIAGGTETVRFLISDELKQASNFWSVLHLQLKPGDPVINYSIDLPPVSAFWQYLIVEQEGRIGGVLTPSKLAMKCMVQGSRYPPSLNLVFQTPATYTEPVKKKVNAIKALPRIRDVYLFQSTNPVALLDGVQPELKILYDTDELVGKVATPSRNRSDTTLIYKL